MKSIQKDIAEPKEIPVNYLWDDWYPIYYFENLNVFFINRDDEILVRVMKPRNQKKSYFAESAYTKQLQKKIDKIFTEYKITSKCIQEETEQIFLYNESMICKVQFVEKKFQSSIINHKWGYLSDFNAYENYLLGFKFKDNYFLLFRKNNFKLLLRQIGRPNQHQCFLADNRFHLLLIEHNDSVLFYKRSFFKLKIIRKFKPGDQRLAFLGRFFGRGNDESDTINIVDSADMKTQQKISSLNHCGYYSIISVAQLELFLIQEWIDKQENELSIKLEQNSLVQKIRCRNYIQSIKYSQALGLLVFQLE